MRYGLTINKLIVSLKSGDWFTKNDLFVEIKYKEQIRRTSVIWDSNKPIWHEGFIFDINIYDSERFTISIFDEDKYSKSEKLFEETLELNLNKEKQEETKFLSVTHGLLNFELLKENEELSRIINDSQTKYENLQKKTKELEIAFNKIKNIQKKCEERLKNN